MNVFDKILKVLELEDDAHRIYTDICSELLNKYANENEKTKYTERIFRATNLHIQVIYLLGEITKELK